jgi:hypothetical protein
MPKSKSKSKTKTTKQKQKQKQSQTVIVNIDTKVKRRRSTKSKKQSHPEKPVSHPSSSIQFSPVINMPSQYQPIPNYNAIQSQNAVPMQSTVRQESYHRSHNNNIPESYLQPIQSYSEPDTVSEFTDAYLPRSHQYETEEYSHFTIPSDDASFQLHPESFQSGAESIQSNLSQASDVRSTSYPQPHGLDNLFRIPETFQSSHESIQSNLSQASDVRSKSSKHSSKAPEAIYEEPQQESETVYEPPTQVAEALNVIPVVHGQQAEIELFDKFQKNAVVTLKGKYTLPKLRELYAKYNHGVPPADSLVKKDIIIALKEKLGPTPISSIAVQAGPSFEDEEIAVREYQLKQTMVLFLIIMMEIMMFLHSLTMIMMHLINTRMQFNNLLLNPHQYNRKLKLFC